MNIIPLKKDAHRDIQELLPWYVTQNLDDDERARVQAHLAVCEDCRMELEVERRIQSLQPLEAGTTEASSGWLKMQARIRSDPTHPQRAVPVLARWMPWVVAAQGALIALLTLVLVLPPGAVPTYRALGTSSAGASARIVVMFRPEATEQQMREALRSAGARLVDGPTSSNAYLLALPEPAVPGALQRLRAQPGVTLAEPLDARPAP
jgi:hypothetical protein